MSSIIPRVIHQIWLGPLEPPKQAMESWRSLHPHWEYCLWTEDNLPILKNQEAFDNSKGYPQKSDILRYELLHEFGGVFIDADEFCLKCIDPLICEMEENNYDVFAVHEGNEGIPDLVANGIMGCKKKSLFMEGLINSIDIDQVGDAWEVVGPKYLTKMLSLGVCDERILILPSKTFFPIHHRQKDRRKISAIDLRNDPEVYGIQLWGSTNFAYQPQFFKNPFQFLRYWSRKLRGKMFQITDLN